MDTIIRNARIRDGVNQPTFDIGIARELRCLCDEPDGYVVEDALNISW